MDIESVKTAVDVLKETESIITSILEPRGLNAATLEGHKKIIDKIVSSDDYDDMEKIALISNYKRIVREYKNCREITEKAVQQLKGEPKLDEVDEDWFSFYFDKVRLVSNETMQSIWSRILSGELTNPGFFSRSLLHTLSVMNASQALLFCSISRFCLREYHKDAKGEESNLVHPLVFISTNRAAYKKLGITNAGLMELETLGLINCDFKDEYVFDKKKVFRTGNKIVEVHGDENNKRKIKAGNITFTHDGQALYTIVGDEYKEYSAEILEHIVTKFQLRNCEVFINNRRVS